MKVRLSDSSVRMRIAQHELLQLAQGDAVHCTCTFDQLHVFQITLKTWLLEVPGYELEKKEWLFQIPTSSIQNASKSKPWQAEWTLESGFRIMVEVDLADFKSKHT